MRTELFCVVTQRIAINSYKRFGTNYRSQFKGSRIPEHIAKQKRKQIDLKQNRSTGKKSHLSIENKFFIFKAVIKRIWRYGIEMYGRASKSDIVTMQRSKYRILRAIKMHLDM
jgi:hypothetical protein